MKASEKEQIRSESLAFMTLLDASTMAERIIDKRLATLTISGAQQKVLVLAYLATESLTPSMLGSLLLKETHDASALLSRLEARGLVTRQSDNLDQRVVLIGLTEQGAEVARQSIELIVSVARDLREILEAKPGVVSTLREVRDVGMTITGVNKAIRGEGLRRVWG